MNARESNQTRVTEHLVTCLVTESSFNGALSIPGLGPKQATYSLTTPPCRVEEGDASGGQGSFYRTRQSSARLGAQVKRTRPVWQNLVSEEVRRNMGGPEVRLDTEPSAKVTKDAQPENVPNVGT